jgi:hypothetical protein
VYDNVTRSTTITVLPGGSFPSKIAVVDVETWWVDLNGNGVWDGMPTDANAIFGYLGAVPVTGDWDGSGTAKIGVYDDIGLWWVDINGNGAWDGTPTDANYWFGYPGAIPVTGDWDGSGTTKIGVYDPSAGLWWVDVNGNGAWDGTPTDANYWFGYPGAIPVTGDWDGSGTTKIGVYDPSAGLWWVDLNGNGVWDGTPTDANYWFGYPGAIPVTGDWDGSGTTKIGVYDPSAGLWWVDLNGNGAWDGTPTDANYWFGYPGTIPATGKW